MVCPKNKQTLCATDTSQFHVGYSDNILGINIQFYLVEYIWRSVFEKLPIFYSVDSRMFVMLVDDLYFYFEYKQNPVTAIIGGDFVNLARGIMSIKVLKKQKMKDAFLCFNGLFNGVCVDLEEMNLLIKLQDMASQGQTNWGTDKLAVPG